MTVISAGAIPRSLIRPCSDHQAPRFLRMPKSGEGTHKRRGSIGRKELTATAMTCTTLRPLRSTEPGTPARLFRLREDVQNLANKGSTTYSSSCAIFSAWTRTCYHEIPLHFLYHSQRSRLTYTDSPMSPQPSTPSTVPSLSTPLDYTNITTIVFGLTAVIIGVLALIKGRGVWTALSAWFSKVIRIGSGDQDSGTPYLI